MYYIILNNLTINSQSEINRVTKNSLRETERLLREANKKSIVNENELYKKAGYAGLKLTSADEQIIKAMGSQTADTFLNMSRSMGFDGMSLQAAYNNILDTAHLQVVTGTQSYQQAIKNATKKLTDQGLGCICFTNSAKYSGYRYENAASVARRAILTGLNKTTNEITMRNAVDLGAELVETTYHSGHRPDHDWGGLVFAFSRNHPKYRNFYDVTRYGHGDGLGGWNCRHSFFPFFEGISTPAYTEDQIKSLDNKITEYNDKKYNPYQATQKQRRMERDIRRMKRELIGYDRGGLKDDYDKAVMELADLQKEYKEFSKAAGLLPQTERLGVQNYGRSEAAKAAHAVKKNNDIISEKLLKNTRDSGIFNHPALKCRE